MRNILQSPDVEVDFQNSEQVHVIIWDEALWEQLNDFHSTLVGFARDYMRNDNFTCKVQLYDLTQPQQVQKYFCRKNKSLLRFIEVLELSMKKY